MNVKYDSYRNLFGVVSRIEFLEGLAMNRGDARRMDLETNTIGDLIPCYEGGIIVCAWIANHLVWFGDYFEGCRIKDAVSFLFFVFKTQPKLCNIKLLADSIKQRRCFVHGGIAVLSKSRKRKLPACRHCCNNFSRDRLDGPKCD